MNKLSIYILFICFTALFAGIANAQTPAPTPTQAPPVLRYDPSQPITPPVLQGDTTNAKPSPTPAKEDEVITVETSLVTTPVSVLDRDGKFIPGLKKKDFKVFENGVPQTITYFQTEDQPFTVILMIDTSPSTKYKIDEIHFAAVTFVNQLRPGDKVMVVSFDQRVRALTPEPTSDRQALYSAIYKATMGSGTSLYEAVDAVVSLDQIKAPGRKAVVLFTDGVDTTSRGATFQNTIAETEEVDALFYPIRYNTQTTGTGVTVAGTNTPAPLPPDIAAMLAQRGLSIDPRLKNVSTGRGSSAAEYERGRQYLEALATNSGGRMYEADTIKNLSDAFAGIAEELRRRYSIGYYPEIAGVAGERRQIKIQVVTRPKVVVRGKNSYVIRGPKKADGSHPASGY